MNRPLTVQDRDAPWADHPARGAERVTLNLKHRYVILRRGVPVFTTDDVTMLVVYLWGKRLWGRDMKPLFVVYDYERPYPVDTTDLCAWERAAGFATADEAE